MTFAHPWLLLLLAVPVLLVAFVFRRGGKPVVLPLDHSGARQSRWLQGTVNVAECVPHLLLAVAIVLLAGPQRLSEPKTRRALTNIEFCVDISGSMGWPFGDGTRYDASMKAIDGFLDYRKGDAFGLTFFGHNVLHWVPLTSDISALRCAPPFMRPEIAPPWFGGTFIGKALLACREVLTAREEGDRMIILVSDGESADFGNGFEDEVARKLRQDNIVVYTVHTGDGEIPDEVVDIASITGGEAFQSDDQDGLHAVFRRIDQMQQAKLEKTSAETLDHYRPWCLAGLSLLGLGLLVSLGLRYTPW